MPRLLQKIRFRLILGFLLSFVGAMVFVVFSYGYFIRIEGKLHTMSRADRLLNLILEARRYEKNYFLYHQERDLKEALAYSSRFVELARSTRHEFIEALTGRSWKRLIQVASEYRDTLSSVQKIAGNLSSPTARDAFQEAVKRIRATGQLLIREAEEFARTELVGARKLLHRYRILFGTFFVCYIVVGGIVVYLLQIRIVAPLETIEETTRRVAKGDFQFIPLPETEDEIGSLVRAFNRMVTEWQENRQQMIQSEKLAALGTLTSGVAHELNNPLSNISTSCQILLEEASSSLDEYHRDLLVAVEDQVVKARDIVRALLEFSRERDFELRPVYLREVIEDTLKLIKGEIPAHVEVRVDIPKGIVLDLDKARMEQALLNLVLNGIQAMEERGGVLTIQAKVTSDGDEIMLEIRDTGTGIPPDILPRIFDPFFTTKEVGKGTGLGLSVTYGIIERMKGKISVQSKEGKGTTFTIVLPLRSFKG